VAALTRTERSLVSEMLLTPEVDGVPTRCVANFDNVHTLPRELLRRQVASLGPQRQAEMCVRLTDSVGC
jgi:mRNA interferase MazF